ncbi:hypothetical protein ACH4NJ_32115 [Streptomyces virginiae]
MAAVGPGALVATSCRTTK